MEQEQQQKFKEEMRIIITETIRTVVNGKIDGLKHDLTNYIEEDLKWKKNADPYINLASNIAGVWKFIIYVVGGLLVLSGFYKIFN